MICLNLVNEYFLHQVETDIQVIQEKLDKSLVSNGRKKTGSYYTPDFVAQYIVEKAISQSLLSKLNKLVSRRLFKDFNELKRKQDSAIFSILFNKILPNFTICDIAMGWGVFLLHSFDYLFSLYKTTFSVLEDEIKRKSSLEDFTERDIEKFIIDSIISNNLYGTDLSSVSTELAKLKFAEKALKLLKEKQIILPTFNFRVGNSLIGLPFEQRTENCSSFSNYRKSVLNGIPSSNREEVNMWLGNETQLNWNHIFPEVSKMGGFDVVIGNPPYINVKRMNLSGRKAYSKLYSTYNPNGDISNVFWERGLDLCNSEGIVSFITPRYWLEGNDSNRLRNHILLNSEILEIIDFRSNRTLFSSTENKLGVDTAIVILRKSKPRNLPFDVYFAQDDSSIQSINKTRLKHTKIRQSSLSEKKWVFEMNPIITQISKRADYHLGDDKKYGDFSGICKIGKGCSTGNNRIFKLKQISNLVYIGANNLTVKLEEEEKDCLKHLIKNSDISPYHWRTRDEFWIFLKDKDIMDYPNIKKYLLNFKGTLEKTQKKYGLKSFYDYAAYRSLKLIENIPKIVCPYQADSNKFALLGSESPPTINETDVISLVIQDTFTKEIGWFYLLTVLNSELLSHYSRIMNKKVYNLYDFRTNQISNFPIMKCEDNSVFLEIGTDLINLLKFSLDSKQTKSMVLIMRNILDFLVYETYFRESLSTQLHDTIKENLSLFQVKEETEDNFKDLVHCWEKRILDEIQQIASFKGVKQIRKTLGIDSNKLPFF